LLVKRFQSRHAVKKPFFSVVVPSYNRHINLRDLMNALSLQTNRDFEVIIVDQSENRWPDAEYDFGFDVFYIHTDIRGTAKARNTAAFYARGSVLAFTDDDCIPEPAWLDKAMVCFVEQKNIIGIEGYIKSDKLNDPEYRPVTNEGLTGIGFMTANLFLKAGVFNRINGFDERFDTPFREDTDLAWRAQEYGEIPFRADVIVFHPPHPRKIERESLIARSKLFEKDALLLKKHPKKYMELFLLENHWKNTEGFWDNFLRGAKKYGIDPNDYDVKKYYPLLLPAGTMMLSPTNATPPGSTIATMIDLSVDLVDKMLSARINLSTEIPQEILAKLTSASSITGQVKMIIGDKTHGGYFDSSVERYNQYFSIAAAFLPIGSAILDIGNAPGHVGIGLHLMGMRVQGLNLNDCWHSTYPSLEWLKTFNVISHDFEKSKLPYDDNFFDAIYFTEVLEHIAVKNPVDILTDFLRVLKPGGLFVMSTPNICNISNIYALLNGKNIFWPNDIFYGSFDRHNREYTPDEVRDVLTQAGFKNRVVYGFNCHSNWRSEGAEYAKRVIDKFGDTNPLFKNTIMVYARK
jgi:GT2 family glycosyltransferase/2-polyprenyl-3-methyl-5-hydroxy-6-metoxy-1,4-benzoquinol methylase